MTIIDLLIRALWRRNFKSEITSKEGNTTPLNQETDLDVDNREQVAVGAPLNMLLNDLYFSYGWYTTLSFYFHKNIVHCHIYITSFSILYNIETKE